MLRRIIRFFAELGLYNASVKALEADATYNLSDSTALRGGADREDDTHDS